MKQNPNQENKTKLNSRARRAVADALVQKFESVRSEQHINGLNEYAGEVEHSLRKLQQARRDLDSAAYLAITNTPTD